jgi:hypothetical protein
MLKPERAYHGQLARVNRPAGPLFLLEPQTYMNLSGKSVAALMRFFKIAPHDMLVVHDEIDLPPGQMKLKLGGGVAPPANTVFVRRWSVEPLPSNPNNTLILQVLVFRNRDRGAANNGAGTLLPEEARLVTVKTRKSQ